ncbi:hypothetical protein [Paraburkholderia sacchari]|uniref:hypothetical protein n=1 Tax=Paraburkholderia sacchari TaxID=159450 RepID=UPI001BCF068D|nr:hypothetical protein [Paraburkholderia sacchari]
MHLSSTFTLAGKTAVVTGSTSGIGPGPVHTNNRLALAAGRAERKDCDEANTRCIRKEHDAAIGPSGGQPLD